MDYFLFNFLGVQFHYTMSYQKHLQRHHLNISIDNSSYFFFLHFLIHNHCQLKFFCHFFINHYIFVHLLLILTHINYTTAPRQTYTKANRHNFVNIFISISTHHINQSNWNRARYGIAILFYIIPIWIIQ